jgi:hypothetical protein
VATFSIKSHSDDNVPKIRRASVTGYIKIFRYQIHSGHAEKEILRLKQNLVTLKSHYF